MPHSSDSGTCGPNLSASTDPQQQKLTRQSIFLSSSFNRQARVSCISQIFAPDHSTMKLPGVKVIGGHGPGPYQGLWILQTFCLTMDTEIFAAPRPRRPLSASSCALHIPQNILCVSAGCLLPNEQPGLQTARPGVWRTGHTHSWGYLGYACIYQTRDTTLLAQEAQPCEESYRGLCASSLVYALRQMSSPVAHSAFPRGGGRGRAGIWGWWLN